MKKVATLNGYDYYMGKSKKGIYYNIVLANTSAPKGGYYSKEYICNDKQVADIFPN